MALWLLMSGLYETLLIGFGVASVALTVFVIRRMDRVDGDGLEIGLNPIAFLKYFLWLLVEIAKANWAVTKLILAPTLATRQHLFRVPYTQRTDLGQTVFANSITLTPGTISVETEQGQFLVHAINYSDEDVTAIADMDARVTATESKSGLVTVTFRSLNSFMRPFVRMPRGFCHPAMNGGDADCRTH